MKMLPQLEVIQEEIIEVAMVHALHVETSDDAVVME
jgi:hypothetical protein